MAGFELKILACVLMVIDHVAEFLPGMPVWMHWIGRLSAPIFYFLIGWSCVYTSNCKRLLLRLYLASVGMSVIQAASSVFVKVNPLSGSGLQPDSIDNNIFATLFQMSLIICLLSTPTWRNKLRNISIYVAIQVAVSMAVSHISGFVDGLPVAGNAILRILDATSGTVLDIEGGVLAIATGVVLWATHGSRLRMSLAFICISLIYFMTATTIPVHVIGRIADAGSDLSGIIVASEIIGTPIYTLGQSAIMVNYQWMKVFALPFMLLYNHKRGPHVKWFFYAFYPAHIVVLYVIGIVMGSHVLP